MCVCPRMCLSSKFIYVYLVYIYLYYCHLQQSHRRKSKQTRTRPISKPAYPPQPGNIPLPRWSCHTVPLDLYYVPVGYDRMLLSECRLHISWTCSSAPATGLLNKPRAQQFNTAEMQLSDWEHYIWTRVWTFLQCEQCWDALESLLLQPQELDCAMYTLGMQHH